MIKSIVTAYRKPGLTREEYNKYWLEQHAPLAAKLIPGVRRYVQNHLVAIPGKEYEVDGIVEMWYDDVESWQKSIKYIRSSEAKVLAEDAAQFCDLRRRVNEWIVQEHVII